MLFGGSSKFFLAVLAGVSVLTVPGQHGAEGAKASLAGLEVPEGLTVELFAADPLLFNPVAFSIDEQGRFFIAESHRWKDSVFDLWSRDDRWKMADFSFTKVEEREKFLREEFATNLTLLTKDSEIIRLVQDKDGDGLAESSEMFADGFNQVTSGTAAGVLASEGNVWFTCIPDLWRFTYGHDGKAASREVLHTGYGVRTSVSGHDLHGLVRGPDGRIYFSVGDRGANVRSREGTQLETVNCGAVFRCEPDGSKLELFAMGLRNPQDLAFDAYGNLWTHDNDTSGDDPPRVLQIVEGGDYGWRQSYQFMPEFGPWVQEKLWEGKLDDVLPAAGFGAQGPSGLAAYPGTGLPEKYRGSLLACDFPQGVWAYFFTPKGASYELRKEHFLWALGPTDVDFGTDGNVYISDWGRSYAMPNAGRLLKVKGSASKAAAEELKALLGGGIKSASISELAHLLGHADTRIRGGAQLELERRPGGAEAGKALVRSATGATNQFSRLHAIWALGNLARRDQQDFSEVFEELSRDSDAEIRAQAAQQLARVAGTKSGAANLIRLLKDASPRVQMYAALSLASAKNNDRTLTRELFQLAARDHGQDAFVRHAAVYALAQNRDLEGIKAAGSDPDPHVRRAAVLCWRRLKSPEIATFLDDSDPTVRRDAARAINDVAIEGAFPALAKQLESGQSDPQILLRAINSNFRLGRSSDWERIARFSTNGNRSEALRIDALRALSDWGNPGKLDRVVGIWRPITTTREAKEPKELADVAERFVTSGTSNLVAAGIESVQKARIGELSGAVASIAQDQNRPVGLRVQALRALGTLRAGVLNETVSQTLSERDSALRAEAVSWLPEIDPGNAVPLIAKIVQTERDVVIRQSALAAAGRLNDPAAARFLSAELDKLAAGNLMPELELDLLDAAEMNGSAILAKKVAELKAKRSGEDSLSPFRWALAGGNAASGRKLYQERDALGCVRCHAIKGQGGIVGPDLGGVATRLKREQLLESVIHPNAQIAAGFESVSVTLKDGRNIAGAVKNESAEEIAVHSTEDGLVTVKKSEIENRISTLSPMPEGLAGLVTGKELRDLVEFLDTLR